VSARDRLLATVLLLGATGCFDRRSDAYTCTLPSDCGDGRTCDQGWCVEVGGALADADPDAPDGEPADAFACPAACSSCDESGTCLIACSAAGSCPTLVTCPPGIACKVDCSGIDSCLAGIDCSAAGSCRIECSLDRACAGPITCGTGVCLVECKGIDSCAGGIECRESCQCQTDCDGAGSCAIDPSCPETGNCFQGGNCTFAPGPCNTC
jgi:hypothetical protein